MGEIDKAIADALAREAVKKQATQTAEDVETAKRDAVTAKLQAFKDEVLVPAFDQVNEALRKGDPPHCLDYTFQGPRSCTMRIYEGQTPGYGATELTLTFKISEHSSGQVRLFTDSDRGDHSTSVPHLSKLITTLTKNDVAQGIVAEWAESIG